MISWELKSYKLINSYTTKCTQQYTAKTSGKWKKNLANEKLSEEKVGKRKLCTSFRGKSYDTVIEHRWTIL